MESKSDLIFSIADTIALYRKRRNRGQMARSHCPDIQDDKGMARRQQELYRLLHEVADLISAEPNGETSRPDGSNRRTSL